MANWPVDDAKARFGDLLEMCRTDGPQIVTDAGRETAVLVSAEDWRRLQPAARPSLKALLLGPGPRDLPLPERGHMRFKVPEILD